MSQKGQILRSLVEQRLTAAVEEIFGLFERTIAEYEEELCRTKEENQRQRQILDEVWNPTVLIHKTGCPVDVHHQSLVKEEVPPEQQEWIPSLDLDQNQEDPEYPHIKVEQEDLLASQEADLTKFPSTPVPVKNEDDEERVYSSHLHQRQSEENRQEAGGADCESQPASSFHRHGHLQAHSDEQTEDCLEHDSVNSDLCKEVCGRQTVTKSCEGANNVECKKKLCCPECGKIFYFKSLLETHMRVHTGEKPFSCSVCGKNFSRKEALVPHMKVHTGEKPFSCPVCGKKFARKEALGPHMKLHTGEKPFGCSECGKRFTQKGTLSIHMKLHTGEKPFNCSVCGTRFVQKINLIHHMKTHTREKPYSCSECSKSFTQKASLHTHMKYHKEEKPFSCEICQKCFKRKQHVQIHMKIHTRENNWVKWPKTQFEYKE